jgi:hypothetical protein
VKDTFTIFVQDDKGAWQKQEVEFTIKGTNDQPVITAHESYDYIDGDRSDLVPDTGDTWDIAAAEQGVVEEGNKPSDYSDIINGQFHASDVDAGAQHGDAVPPGDLVQLGRQLRLLGLGISHLLGGGDDVHAPLHNKHQFVIDITGKGVGAHHHDIGGGPDDLLGGAHDHVLAVAALNAGHHVIQALAQLGADVDGAHNIHALLFAEHLADAAAHGAQSPENYLHIFHAAFILSVTGRVVQVLCPVCG